MKFLDPHDKLILDLRDEIKRLKNENKKLRSTILTAPASGEKGSYFSGEETSPSRHRAISAHSSLVSHKAVARKSPTKRKKAPKMKSSHSDFMAEYGHRIKSLSPTKNRSVTKRSASLAQVDHSTRPILELSREDEDHSVLDDLDDGELSSGSSRKKMSQAQLEDLVRRRAVGPMVFKGKDAILPVRESHPGSQMVIANSYERSLEAARISKLERRLAKIEKIEAMRASGDSQSVHRCELRSVSFLTHLLIYFLSTATKQHTTSLWTSTCWSRWSCPLTSRQCTPRSRLRARRAMAAPCPRSPLLRRPRRRRSPPPRRTRSPRILVRNAICNTKAF